MSTHEIPGRVARVTGGGGLPKLIVTSEQSTAEIYLHGAHVTSFTRHGAAPLLFLSDETRFAADQAIRGGVPIIYPWFGPRDGERAHGFARVTNWELVETTASPSGSVSVRLRLPASAATLAKFPAMQVDYSITVADTLTLALDVTNPTDSAFVFESCLHTYFAIDALEKIAIHGLIGATYIDQTDQRARKRESAEAITIVGETDRVYLDTTATVTIQDGPRTIRIDKSGSRSTVVWNPWAAKAKALTDFGDEEFRKMICVESGNVADDKLTLLPGQTATLKVTIGA